MSKQQKKGFTKEQLANFEKWWRQVSKKIEIEDVSGPVKIGPPKEDETPRFKPSVWPVPPEKLQEHLDKYRGLALSLGAESAEIIPASDIRLDVRALYVGCTMPCCRWLNTTKNCPLARTFLFEDMQKFVGEYKHAVVFKVKAPVINKVPDVGPINLDRYYRAGGGPAPDKEMLAKNIIRLRILAEMTRRIRQVTFYDGYMMSAPVYPSPCLLTKCADIGKCPALDVGGLCRFEDTSPSAATVYIDYFTLARKLGWGELQVGGNCAFPEDVPDPAAYYNIGLVLIN